MTQITQIESLSSAAAGDPDGNRAGLAMRFDEHRRALGLNYLAATGYQCGLLLNFGTANLDYKQYVLTKPRWSAEP